MRGPQNQRANQFSAKCSLPRRVQFSRTAARVTETSREPWQRIADKLIDIDATNDERIAAVRNLLERREDVQKDLTDAAQAIVRDRNVETAKDILYPTGTEARKQIDGFEVVLRQLQEDIVPELNQYSRTQGNATLASLRSTLSNPQAIAKSLQTTPNVNATEIVNELRAEFTELQKHPEEIQKRLMSYVEESKNVFRRTPVGLEMPSYKVISTAKDYEVREYEPYSIIATPTRKQAVSPNNPAATTTANAKAFNTLASYLFGKNEGNKAMAMTAPVEMIADGQGSKTMAFILPNEVSESAPSPSKGDEISIQRLPAQTVAVLEFPGFATEKEIKAQKEKLLSSLQTDGRFTPIDDTDSFRVLQWNPPYTLPWLRRNEICIKVKEVESAAGSNVVLDAVE